MVGRASRIISAQHTRLQESLDQTRALLAQNEDLNERVRRAAAPESPRRDQRLRRRRRDELERLEARLRMLSPIVTQVIGMTRAVYDRYDDGLPAEPAVRAIAEQLHRAAHDARRVVRRASADPSEPPTASIPALTAPLALGAPASEHWILIGSLLEDLRRIHESLSDDPAA